VTEGVHLLKNGISPYEGDLFHETPLHLLVYSWLVLLKQPLLDLVFILVDACTCLFLQTLAANYTNQAVIFCFRSYFILLVNFFHSGVERETEQKEVRRRLARNNAD
jgi:GPI transamidase subunit PIG-U